MDYASLILHFKCLIAVAIGLGIHTASKFQEVKKLHEKAHEDFTFVKFLEGAKVSHIINSLCVLIYFIALPDVIKAIPTIYGSKAAANVMHIFLCGIIGYSNSSIILKVFGSGKKYILHRIDEKTNRKKNEE